MPSTSLRTLIPHVSIHMNNVPEPATLSALNRAAKQFCQDSRAWDVLLGTLTLDPQDRPLEVDVPNENYIGAYNPATTYTAGNIVLYNDDYYTHISDSSMNVAPDATNSVENLRGSYHWSIRGGILLLPANSYVNSISRIIKHVPPDDREMPVDPTMLEYNPVTRILTMATGTITGSTTDYDVYAVLEPTLGSTSVPSFLVELYYEALVDFAVYRLMDSSDKAWSDPAHAQHFRMAYQRRVAEATVSAAKKHIKTDFLQAKPIGIY